MDIQYKERDQMSDRITQSQLDKAIERLAEVTGLPITTYNAYGYSQLAVKVEGGGISMFSATYGDSKKDLYYQIEFALDVLGKMRKAKEKGS